MNIFWHIYAIQYYAKLKELVTTRFIIRLKKKICSNVHNMIYETFALNQNSMFVCTFGEHGERCGKIHQAVFIGYFSGVGLKEMLGWDL